MNIVIDTVIFALQQHGGASRLWRNLAPALHDALPDATFDPALPANWFISTYYQRAPLGVRSLTLVYDMICNRYPLIDTNRADAVDCRTVIAEASAVASISQTTADDVKRYTGRDSVVAYPGVAADFGHVTPSAVRHFQQFIGKPYFLMVGNRALYKNAQAVYQAWHSFAGRHGYALVCVGGEEPLPQDVAFRDHSRDTWQHIRMGDDTLNAAYAGATALVYPSLMEGFGLPLVEAMACACPVICDPALHEAAGEAAVYVDMTKPQDIAQALDAVQSYDIRLTCMERGIEQARRYTWSGMAKIIAGVLTA